MAVNLSPYGGVGAQFLDNSGNVLTGGKIFTYAAGTTTNQATYTTSAGNIPHSNPIILDASGRVPSGGEIWLTDGSSYKFILRDSNDVLIATYDNISGINSNFVAFTNEQEIQTATAGQTVFNLTTTTYSPGTNSLSVFVDGVNQYGPGAQYAYVETDNDTVTFVNGLHVGALVKFTTSQLNSSASQSDAFQVSYTPPFTNSVGTNVGDTLAQTVSVKNFGATGDGVTDDTAAINNALTYQNSAQIALHFPAGNYLYNGTGFATSGNSIVIFGDGYGVTKITLGATSRFIDTPNLVASINISGINFYGGLGAYRSTYAGVNVAYFRCFENNFFENYTVCAIDQNSLDSPYWKITQNIFFAANSSSTIGVALSTGADKSEISGNAFEKNTVHIKLKNAGVACNIYNNDFIQFEAGTGVKRSPLWIVPNPTSTNAGTGLVILGNKFGNETQQSTDYRILIADEGSGTSNGAKLPVYTASTGYVIGVNIQSNKFVGAFSLPVIYSTTPNLRNNNILDNIFDGVFPSYIIEFRSALTFDYLNQTNVFSNNAGAEQDITSPGIYATNAIGAGAVLDPTSQYEFDATNYHSQMGGIDCGNLVILATSLTTALTGNGGATSVAATDITGGSDAATWTFTVGSNVTLPITGSSITVGQPTWLEFDISRGTSSPLSQMLVQITDGTNLYYQRYIAIAVAQAAKFRFPIYFRDNAAAFYFVTFLPVTPTSGTAKIGRTRVYQSREPIAIGRTRFEQFNLSALPTSAAGLAAGSIWVDTSAGNVLKRV
jgi:hypothetical protein